MEVLDSKDKEWTKDTLNRLSEALATVFLEDWGGPRSPMALRYIHETIIPDLMHCLRHNGDLLQNPSFAEVISWKLKTQFAYPTSIAGSLATDLLQVAQDMVIIPQVTDPREPWRRTFRLWVSGETLPNIVERTGYPLDYLDLLLLRLKKLRRFIAGRRVSLLECLQHEELKAYGFEQLSFLYQFESSLAGEPLFRERLALEQVIHELGVPLEVSDLVTLLEVIHQQEGRLDEPSLIAALREVTVPVGAGGSGKAYLFPEILQGLISVYWVHKNKAGKLALSEKSAQILAGFLLPRLAERVEEAINAKDMARAKEILLEQNPEILARLIGRLAKELNAAASFELLTSAYKQVSRRIDLQILEGLGGVDMALGFLLGALSDKDSLLRAKACEALGRLGNEEAIAPLSERLEDEVPGVREKAAEALGKLKAQAAAEALADRAGDIAEAILVREAAREALRGIRS
ncbi:MAG: HEAT repeat domain-containing protein [Desulfitobacteriaceae bacterium]|nr:HEAT repeat domain-containing protein [Desulfitobacteriaceae bacterium]MDI6880587.1 HEAT repeat domain-containing protein [Desulfitobacteriaceae bacterium]MDI6914637.1 HEAT repeat domain-containing protein [Desulfitobacteriaceae bacterium]